MKRILIIFAKEPKKGKVKTRLSSHLSQAQCLKIYKQLLRNTVQLSRNVKCSQKVIAYDSDNQPPYFLKRIAMDFEFYEQKGKDLGERMFIAFKKFTINNTKAVIIGSDSPGLPKSYVTKAFCELNKKDVVLGPCYDGGYYLIGLKKPCRQIFEGIEWSSGTVFERTLQKAKRLKKKIAVLNFWYDIDRPQDLKRLKERSLHY